MTACLLKDCDKPARDRGLCHNHANGMRYHIKLGNMTWTDLEMHGLALPKRRAGRKRTQTMVDAIEQVQKVSQKEAK